MALYGGARDISKPIDPANLAMALEKRPSPSALSSYAYGAYSGPAIKSASNLSTNPYVLTGYQNALQQVRGYQTGGKVPGGEIKPLQGGAVEFVGRTHKEGGIMIDPSTEVEDGETMDKVNMVDKQGDYIFSNYLKLGGKTFAQRHKEILNMVGRSCSQSGCFSLIIVIIGSLFGLLGIIISLDQRELGKEVEKKRQQQSAVKLPIFLRKVEPSKCGEMAYKLVPSCILMNALKQPAD